MKKTKLIAMTMAIAMTLGSAALAADTTVPGYGGHEPGEAEKEANGHTTISIFSAKKNPKNVSFEVPLYVTMAVIDSATAVAAPDNYAIRNTTTTADGDFDIGVTAMYFEKLAGSTFNTVADTVAVANATDIYLTIGQAKMPALTAAEQKQVTLESTAFMGADSKPIAIKAPATATGADVGKDKLALAITGAVTAAVRTNTGAVAQFRVKYTVSPLSTDGDPLGVVYAGDDSYVAGLGAQPKP